MRKLEKFKTLEEAIVFLQKKAKTAPISLQEVLFHLSGKGRVLMLILLSLPFCQPLQIPGISIFFGLAIAFIGLRMAFGKNIWLPKRVLEKKIRYRTFKKITDKTLWLLKKMKRFIHPRLPWLCHSKFMHITNGLVICILGLLLALPLPVPFTNLSAAWSIFLMSVGTIEDDGLFIIFAYIMCLVTFAIFTSIIFTLEKIF